MSGNYRKDHNCLNCGFHVEEHYCSRCGQPNLELKENFWEFISHSVAHYFHFDNKFFQTLKPLLTKPGQVTVDYLAGKRARYINPVSMYIFVSIVYFIVVAPPKHKTKEKTGHVKSKNLSAEQKAAFNKAKAELIKIGIDTSSAIIKEADESLLEEIDRSTFRKLGFKEQSKTLQELKTANKVRKSEKIADLIDVFEEIHEIRGDSTYDSYLVRQGKLPQEERDNMIERYMRKRSYGISQKSDLLQEQLERNRSKQYFLFMPLMALFVMVNFRKNNIRYMDHLIFTIHGMTAFFIVLILTNPIKRFVFPQWSGMSVILELATIIWVAWYLYKSLKVLYQRKNSTTFWRMVWIVFLYSITLEFSEAIMRNILYYLN